MTDIKRYSITTHQAKVEESPTGNWIKASDHDAVITQLSSENERLRDDNNALRGYLKVADKQFEEACEKVDFFIKSEQRLRSENEVLKVSIAKLKADAVREAAVLTADNDVGCYVIRDKVARDTLIVYADKLESQATKGRE